MFVFINAKLDKIYFVKQYYWAIFAKKILSWENQFHNISFEFLGKKACVCFPETKNGKWIVRPAFLGAFPYVDEKLLKKGYTVAYIDET